MDMDTVRTIMRVYFDFQCASCTDNFLDAPAKGDGSPVTEKRPESEKAPESSGHLSWLANPSKLIRDYTPPQWYALIAFETVANELKIPLKTDYHRSFRIDHPVIKSIEEDSRRNRDIERYGIDGSGLASSAQPIENPQSVAPEVVKPSILNSHYIPDAPAAPPPPLVFPQKDRPLRKGVMLPSRHKDTLVLKKQGPFPEVDGQTEMKTTLKSPRSKPLENVVSELKSGAVKLKPLKPDEKSKPEANELLQSIQDSKAGLRKVEPRDKNSKPAFTTPGDLSGLMQKALSKMFKNAAPRDEKDPSSLEVKTDSSWDTYNPN